MKTFDIVVATDEELGIARGGALPWHVPADLAHFKRVTSEAAPGKRNAVFMGRATWETIPDR
ncbi:MAG TPA: dihydrofolate reductase, partial [Kofleriaceae bacterium]|nr:dihydrofolate reductase [Kofleriaceae bacterium]